MDRFLESTSEAIVMFSALLPWKFYILQLWRHSHKMNEYQNLSVLHNNAIYHKTIILLTFIVDKNLVQHKFTTQFFHCIIDRNHSWFPFFDSDEALKERPQTQKLLYNRPHDLGSTTFSMRQEAIECLHSFIESFYKSRQKPTQKLPVTL